MSNPFQSPQFPTEPIPATPGMADREKLRRVAKFQQWVLYALLANIVLNIAAMSARGSIAASLVILLLALVVIAATMYAIFNLALELYGVVAGVVCAAIMIVPCASLLALLIVNGKATSFLQQHGIQVGFMGVDPKSIG